MKPKLRVPSHVGSSTSNSTTLSQQPTTSSSVNVARVRPQMDSDSGVRSRITQQNHLSTSAERQRSVMANAASVSNPNVSGSNFTDAGVGAIGAAEGHNTYSSSCTLYWMILNFLYFVD